MLDYNVKNKWEYDKSASKKSKLEKLRTMPKLSNLSNNALEILYNRGFNTLESIEDFLYKGLDDLHNSKLLKDAEKAVEIIMNNITSSNLFVNYSDYDADGVTSCIICVRGLRKAGAKVEYYTNNRFIDGYGMCPAGVDKLVSKFPDVKVIITTDNGIMAFEGIKRAKEFGIQVIVTDHHEPGDTLPEADAIVDPKRKDCEYPFKGLCGAGVIFKLMLLLYYEMDLDMNYIYDMMDILAVGTVGDVVPLVDENRIFVREGIKIVKQEKRFVFKALREQITKVNPRAVERIDAETFGFVYVPMVNSLGRMDGVPDGAIEMFLSDNEDEIRKWVDYLIAVNENRKELTKVQQELAEEILEKKGLREVIVLYDKSFHEGIVGLIAGRLKDKYCRPTIILSEHSGISGVLKGSSRSIPGFHLFEELKEITNTMLGFGGHAMAAGLSLEECNLEKFEEGIVALAKAKLSKDDYIPKLQIDTVLKATTMKASIVDELEILQPFGEAFRKPLFGLTDFVSDKEPFFMGSEKQHVKLTLGNMSVIIWNNRVEYESMGNPKKIKALGYPSINVFRNTVSVQFIVQGDEYRGVS